MKQKTRKHIMGLIVEDKPGVMERVSGMFARRGFNIDTIVVGKTKENGKSHIVISLFEDEKTIEQVEKQVNKIIDVVKIVDLDSSHSVVREHCLLKISSKPETRQDLTNFIELHKAKVLDVNHETIIVEVVGSPEKVDSFVSLMEKYGIIEMSRTGVNALQRG